MNRADLAIPSPGRPPLGRVAVAGWCTLLVIAAQLPFAAVWTGTGFFFYDAFTVFAPLLTAQAAQLAAGIGILNLDQELIPTQVASPYAFSNLLRQVTAVLVPAGPHAHSLIQATHIMLTQVAVAFLFRTLGVAYRYGLVGGLVYILSGIHVSLTQHVNASEALLYLVLSLAMLRLFVRSADGARQVFYGSAAAIFLVCLVRGHHEAVLYVVPVSAWALVHLAARWKDLDRQGRARKVGGLGLIGAAVLASSIPMLAYTYELTQFNKTRVADFSELGSYFADAKAFMLGLLYPHSTGSFSSGVFWLRQDPTLAYIFAGSLTIPLLVAYLHECLRIRRRLEFFIVAASIVLLGGFAFGGGPVYRALCWLFPPFVQIGHSHYGLHLLYLVTAFGVACGIRAVAERGAHVAFVVAATAFVLAAWGGYAWIVNGPTPRGFVGNEAIFHGALRADILFLVAVTLACAALAAGIRWMTRRDAAEASAGDRAYSSLVPGLAILGLGACVAADMLRPMWDAPFLPTRAHATWAASEHGGFNPGKPIVAYLDSKARIEPSFRSVRVLPLFPQAGGWQSNALWTVGVALVSTPGDSGGNRYLEDELKAPPTPARLDWLAEKFGVDYFWIARWGAEAWAKAASASPSLTLVASDPWGGDLYRFSPSAPGADLRPAPGNAELGWFLPEGKATRHIGLLATTRTFETTGEVKTAEPVPARITLPVMWKAFFSASDGSGNPLSTFRDELGRLQVSLPPSGGGWITVEYPRPLIQAGIAMAAAVYLGLLVLCAISGAALLRRPLVPPELAAETA